MDANNPYEVIQVGGVWARVLDELDGVLTVRISGALRADEAVKAIDELVDGLAAVGLPVIVDLFALADADARGITSLARACALLGPGVRLIGIAPYLQPLLAADGVSHLIAPDRRAARAALSSSSI